MVNNKDIYELFKEHKKLSVNEVLRLVRNNYNYSRRAFKLMVDVVLLRLEAGEMIIKTGMDVYELNDMK